MPFQFKNFFVEDTYCAMKVGTDAVLLGAWADAHGAKTILDIGSGTGIISLMLAQRSPSAIIDAIDADVFAYEQSLKNIATSPFATQNLHIRVQAYHSTVREWMHIPGKQFQYDVLICNPPFFSNGFQVAEKQRAKARVAEYLPQTDLVIAATKLLHHDGKLSVIYPVKEAEEFIALCLKSGLYCRRKTGVYPKENQPAKRILLEMVKQPSETRFDKIIIEHTIQHDYTDAYKQLTKDFYLQF